MLQGLANLGNTCSINTLIQCLGHCDPFRKALLDCTAFTKKKDNRFSLTEELQRIIRDMWIHEKSLMPIRMAKCFQEVIGIRLGEQLDFSELFMLTLNAIVEETHSDSFKSKLITDYKPKDPINKHIQKVTLEAWKLHLKDSASVFGDIFKGTQIQQIKCNHCGKTYHNVEPLTCTYIELVHDDLGKCMDGFHRTEELTDWVCDKCKEKSAERIWRFWDLPEVWVVVLKRFDHEKKIHKPIQIMHSFEIPALCQPKIMLRYELVAIANHFGSLNGGHYNAICRDSDGWYLYDDTHISKVNIDEVLHSNHGAYVLFYQRLQ